VAAGAAAARCSARVRVTLPGAPAAGRADVPGVEDVSLLSNMLG